MCQDSLRILYGVAAKNYGKKFDAVPVEGFNEEILEAIRCKLRQNKYILQLLVASDLPLKHYYWYGDIKNPKVYDLPQHNWMLEEIDRIRVVCKEVGYGIHS